MRRVGIIGAGRFGMALAQSLVESGIEVLLLERDPGLVQAALDVVAESVQGDATVERTLEEAGFGECDVAVVAIGSNIEASTLALANCKELGIPQVYAKASSELHGKILLKLGADQVIYPDRDSAHRLAHTVMSGGAFDLLEISEGCSIAEIDVPESCAEKTLAQADLRKKTGVTVLCIRRLDENPKKPRQILIPGPTDMVRVDDKLIVFGTRRQIDSLTGGDD